MQRFNLRFGDVRLGVFGLLAAAPKWRFFRPDLATNWLTMKIVLFFLTIAREILLITLLRVWH